ncbi:hypothetical protein [Mycobacterium intracellulare]|uniref:hypothetical protein n=1 Tax=Mycobacterium intracellulare TaxID=1767 RepID=UPI00115BCEC6|nr:hypothetical protein [Mycobacterium intracellulare]
MSDDLAAKVAQLLGEPPPPDLRPPQKKIHTGGPIGLALTAFRMAKNLVCKLNYFEAVNDWEHRQARLKELGDLLNSKKVNDADRGARAEVEALRLRGRALWERTAALSSALGVVTKDVAMIVRGCGERVAAENGMAAVAKPTDPMVARRRACEQIDVETLRVLELHDRTAVMSVADVYGLVAQRN